MDAMEVRQRAMRHRQSAAALLAARLSFAIAGTVLALPPAVVPAAAQQPGEAAAGRQAEQIVAATVDGRPILLAEVERHVRDAFGSRAIAEEARPHLMAEALELLIDRRLVMRHLEQAGLAPSRHDLQLAREQFTARLRQQYITWEEYLAREGIDATQWEQRTAWRIGWQRLREKHLTEENLRRHFERHRPQFDGTQLRVAHVLLPAATPAEFAAARRQAEALRAQIVGGEVTFAEAAAKHSLSPTAARGGEIGWIERYGSMPEPFAAAAFALPPGEISRPIESPVGVHLITCLERQPGARRFEDVKEQVYDAAAEYLFRWAADGQRSAARIERTGAVPDVPPSRQSLSP